MNFQWNVPEWVRELQVYCNLSQFLVIKIIKQAIEYEFNRLYLFIQAQAQITSLNGGHLMCLRLVTFHARFILIF